MIRRHDEFCDHFKVECDACLRPSLTIIAKDFRTVVDFIRGKGWKSVRRWVQPTWVQICDECDALGIGRFTNPKDYPRNQGGDDA